MSRSLDFEWDDFLLYSLVLCFYEDKPPGKQSACQELDGSVQQHDARNFESKIIVNG
jgi:hypothetical protein